MFGKKTNDKERRYGGDRTIHRNNAVDVEVDKDGNVVSVWFRCQPIPFNQSLSDDRRAEEMRRLYASTPGIPGLVEIVLED